MLMLMTIKIPHEPFNNFIRKGTAAKTIEKILHAIKPKAAYFTEVDGNRGALLVVDMKDPSDIPMLAEPWFLSFNADVSFRAAMTPEDLAHAHLDIVSKGW